MSKDKDNLRYYTYQLNMKVLNILAILLFIGIILVIYLVGYDFSSISEYNLFWLFILLFLWLILHEVLHGIGFALFKEVDLKNIVFGMALEKGVFYCMCKQQINKKVIFTSLLFPVTFIGVITLIIGIITGIDLLIYLSIFNIVGSIGDIVMSIYFSRCSNDVIYLDLDDCTSFTVLSKKDLSNIRIWGIKLVDSGNYDSNMVALDRRRVVISKFSWGVLIIIMGLMFFWILRGFL